MPLIHGINTVGAKTGPFNLMSHAT